MEGQINEKTSRSLKIDEYSDAQQRAYCRNGYEDGLEMCIKDNSLEKEKDRRECTMNRIPIELQQL